MQALDGIKKFIDSFFPFFPFWVDLLVFLFFLTVFVVAIQLGTTKKTSKQQFTALEQFVRMGFILFLIALIVKVLFWLGSQLFSFKLEGLGKWIGILFVVLILVIIIRTKKGMKKVEWMATVQKLSTTFTALAVAAAAILVAIILYQRQTSAKIRDINHPGTDILVQRAVRAEQKAERERNSQTKPPKGSNFPLNQTVLFQKGVSYQFTRGINTTLCFDPSDHTVRIRVENGNLGWTLWFDESKNVHFENFKDNPVIIEGWSFSVDKDVYMRLYWY